MTFGGQVLVCSGGRGVGRGVGVASLRCGDLVYPRNRFLLPAVR